ncbi:MAG: DNA polymerase I, partial [Chitinispirillaceae bacterium]|nr:DNA polymerase I [Chitinispirillaceae bacterium]
LIGPNVTMLAPEGSGMLVPFGEKEVVEKLGVRPSQVGDYLALIGDSSDNIPGIPGIGPKTAVKILDEANSIEKLLKNPSLVSNQKLREKIETNKDLLMLSQKLVTLNIDSQFDISIDELSRNSINFDKCVTLLREMECFSLLKSSLFERRTTIKKNVIILDKIDEFNIFVSKLLKENMVAFLSLSWGNVFSDFKHLGIAFATNENECYYVPLAHKNYKNISLGEVKDKLNQFFDSESILKIGYDLKREYHIAQLSGYSFKGQFFDSMVAAYVIEPGKRDYSLHSLINEWLKIESTPLESLVGKGRNKRTLEEIEIEEISPYIGNLVCSLLPLKEKLKKTLDERGISELFDKIEMPLVFILAKMERAGVKIDTKYLEKLSEEYKKRLDHIAKEIYHIAGKEFNLNSPKQIGEVLFKELKLPAPKKTKGGAHSTDVEVLETLSLDHPIAKKILEYRELQKLLSTYIDALPSQINKTTGRIHTTFNQTITATGRLSSTEPNLQNIPVRTEEGKKIRDGFVAEKGKLIVAADYSQIELRVLAHISKDPFLMAAFTEGRDIHIETASAIYGVFPEMVTPEMRRIAKTINFGLIYGMGPINLGKQLGIPFKEAKMFIEAYFKQFPNIKKYMDTAIDNARKLGYTETILGRRRYLPEINSSNRIIREAAERIAINTPVQGSAADIIKIAMIEIDKELSKEFPEVNTILQVHDELVFEVPEKETNKFCAWVKKKMESAYSLAVPLHVDVKAGKNWNEAH